MPGELNGVLWLAARVGRSIARLEVEAGTPMELDAAVTRDPVIHHLPEDWVPEGESGLGLGEEVGIDGALQRLEQLALRSRPDSLQRGIGELAAKNGADRKGVVLCSRER